MDVNKEFYNITSFLSAARRPRKRKNLNRCLPFEWLLVRNYYLARIIMLHIHIHLNEVDYDWNTAIHMVKGKRERELRNSRIGQRRNREFRDPMTVKLQ